MIKQVDKSVLSYYLEGLVSFGTRKTGSENCSKAAEYINNEFIKLGLESYIDNWKYPRHECQNVIATYYGSDIDSDAVFMISAHMDTIGNSVGANDDGSGIAAMLSIANIISEYSFNHSIRFIAASGHEVGTYGSNDYAKKVYRNDENIIGVINVDMIGNTTKGNIVQISRPSRSEWLEIFANNICENYKEYMDIIVQRIPNYPVDHQSFVNYGYDGISFVQANVFEYPIHTPEDSLEKINYTYLENVTKLVLAMIANLANKPIDLQVRIETPFEGYIYFYSNPVFELPGCNLYLTKLRGMTYSFGKSIMKINISNKEQIISVMFSIDGETNYFSIFYEPVYEWEIHGLVYPLIGKHTIGVTVNTIDGKTSYDEMDIFIITSSPF
jgi:hypothetical protein